MIHHQTNTAKHYQQLKFGDRATIQALRADGKTLDEIATELHRNKGTISRELNRGAVAQMDANRRVHQVYFADAAQRQHQERRDRRGQHNLLKTARTFFAALTKELLRKPRVHSVDSFVHDYQIRHPNRVCPSTTTVYRYIDQGLLSLDNMALRTKLRRRVKNSRRTHKRMNKHILGDSIATRPDAVAKRTGTGHWEGDLIKGVRSADEPALMTLTERYSRTEIIVKVPNYHSDTCLSALQATIDDYGAREFKTITFDNGSEFAQLSKVMGTHIYFAHPNSPWERGSNENANGLLREFFPKGKSFREVSLIDVQAAQSALNSRPRRILGYLRSCDYYRNMI